MTSEGFSCLHCARRSKLAEDDTVSHTLERQNLRQHQAAILGSNIIFDMPLSCRWACYLLIAALRPHTDGGIAREDFPRANRQDGEVAY